jgi:adenosylhomocysteine nucleosidase
MQIKPNFVVIISANTEWAVITKCYSNAKWGTSPYGEWFTTEITVANQSKTTLFFHGGWGKIAAAASTQYVIDCWSPQLLVNLGTCGGFRGKIEKGTIILVEKTIVYDIYEQMVEPTAALAHYTTELNLSWLSGDYPHPVIRTLLVSGDRDIMTDQIDQLQQDFGAVAADWESAAIAYIARRNGTRCLILRGVSDLVGADGGDAYAGNFQVFAKGTAQIMTQLVEALPGWLALST